MTRSYRKNILRTFKSTRNRFVAVFSIVALGVGFLAGLNSTPDDMKESMEAYMDAGNFYDLRVVSTLGLTDDDVHALQQVQGIQAVQPGYSADLLVDVAGDTVVARAHSLPPENDTAINRLALQEGRFPQNPGECVVEAGATTASAVTYPVGSKLTVSSENEDLDTKLNTTEFTVVGIVHNANYFSFEREPASVGNGTVKLIMYLPMQDFAYEAYTEIYMTADGALEKDSLSDEYTAYIDEVKANVEAIADARCQARYDGIVADAQAEIDDAWAEYNDAKAEADEKLADAAAELADGRKQLNDGQAEYLDGEKKYADGAAELAENEQKLNDGAAQLADAEQQLQDAEAQLAAGEAELAANEPKLDEARQKLEQGQAEYEAGLKKYKDGLAAIEAGEAELAAQKEQARGLLTLNDAYNQYQAGLTAVTPLLLQLGLPEDQADAYIANLGTQSPESLPNNTQTLVASITAFVTPQVPAASQADEEDSGDTDNPAAGENPQLPEIPAETFTQLAALVQGRVQLYNGLQQLVQQLGQANPSITGETAALAYVQQTAAQIAAAETQLQQGRAELEAGKPQLDAAKQQLDDGWKQYNDGVQQLQNGKKQLADARTALQEGWATLTDKKLQMADARRQIDDAKVQLTDSRAKLDDARATIAENAQKLRDGEIDYEDAKAEAEEKLADARAEIEDGEKQIADIEMPEWYVWDRSKNVSYSSFTSNVSKLTAITTIFPIFFFLVAALVVSTTMTRMVEEERLQIGTLKALGYTRGEIMQKYLRYALIAAAAGTAVGLAVGFRAFPTIIWSAYGMMYYMPAIVTPWRLQQALFAGGTLIALTVGITALACRNSLAESPAALMLPRAPKAGKRILLERITPLWRRLPFSWKVTCRNLMRYKKRFWMTVIGVAGCTSLLVAGFGIRDSLDSIITKQYGDVYHYELMTIVTKEDALNSGAVHEYLFEDTATFPESLTVSMETTRQDTAAGEMDVYLMIPQDVAQFADFADLHERVSRKAVPLQQNGVVVTEKMASTLGIAAGDTLTLTNGNDKTGTFTVTGVCEHYLSNYVYMSPATYTEAFGEAPSFNAVLSKMTDDSQSVRDAVSAKLLDMDNVASLNFTQDMITQVLNMLNSINAVTVLIIVCAAMLAFVVLYNLSNINIAERVKEIATIKVLGFYEREVYGYVNRESVALTLIGTVLGLFGGIGLHTFVMRTVEVDAVMFGREIAPLSFVYAVLLTLLFSTLVNLVMGRMLKKISMVESMKAPE